MGLVLASLAAAVTLWVVSVLGLAFAIRKGPREDRWLLVAGGSWILGAFAYGVTVFALFNP